MKKRGKGISKKVIIVSISSVAFVILCVAAYLLFFNNIINNLPDFSSNAEAYDAIKNISQSNVFDGAKINPFENITVINDTHINYNSTLPEELKTDYGSCSTVNECKDFCNKADNMIACLDYAEQNNLMTAEQIAKARKIIPYIQSGQSPGGCKTETECWAYCDNTGNVNQCVDFGVLIGDVSPDEAALIKKLGGKGPGGCRGKDECDAYCKANPDPCADFLVQNGIITAQDADMMKKTNGQTPGNCGSQAECDAYCNSEAGRSVCLEFAHQYGLISEEEYQQHLQEQQGMPNGMPPGSENGTNPNWCEEHPGQCTQNSSPGGDTSQGNLPCTTPEECCAMNPALCQAPPTPNPEPPPLPPGENPTPENPPLDSGGSDTGTGTGE